ncbi:claspin isoform X3 [Ixodes scapularis]|uniref:claspin isoform X3 n=1 Tax=Ixodes scapularis TaxID=6945 RepID=UPI001C38405D|nr:claspin isoform X3 [Ixodes scapularis]
MNEMLDKFDSASDGQLLEKEHFLEPEVSPSPERFEVKDSGSGMGVEGAPESSSPETRPYPALDEVPPSIGASNGGELLTADTFQGGERALASPLGVCAPTDHDVDLPEVGMNAVTSDDEKSAAKSDGRGSKFGPASPDVASHDVASQDVASHDGCKQLPVVASDVSGPARDVGVVSLDTATSDDECDDPPVLALLPRRGSSNGVACSDESGDASDASPKPSGRDFADEAASSDDERQSASVAVDGNEKADTDSTPKRPKDQKVQRKSAQRAASELQQIYSTSQRMARENKMALPYHEPAKLSLKAFLDQMRSKPSPEQLQQPAQGHVEEQALPLEGQPSVRSAEGDTPGTSAPFPQPNEDLQDSKEAFEVDHASTKQEGGSADGSATCLSAESATGCVRFSTPLLGRHRRNVLALAGNLTPCLSKDPVIVLGNEDGPSGVARLLDRLVKHAKANPGKAKEQPKASVTPNVGLFEETSIPKSGPGQLVALREQLLRKVRQERHRSRQERFQQKQFYDEEALPPGADSRSDDPLAALGDEEEEEILSDVESASSDDNDGADTSDEEEVVASRKKSRRINPVLEDDDDEDIPSPKKNEGRPQKVHDVEDDSDDGFLELPAFDDADDEDEPSASGAQESRSQLEDDLKDPLGAGGVASAASALSPERADKSFQSDEPLVFSPLTGLLSVRRKLPSQTASQDVLTPASDALPATPPRSAIKEAPSLPLSPLVSVDSASVTPLRKSLSGRFERPWAAEPSQDMDELVGLCSGSFGARNGASEAGDTGSQFGDKAHLASATDPENDDVDDVEGDGEDANARDEAEDEGEHDDQGQDEDEDEDGEEDNEEEDEEEEIGITESRAKKRSLRDFFEDEAELSGSDVGSDGEEGEEDEEGVLADLIAAEDDKEDSSKLREEIGRFHFKQLLDEDKRELKIYQELLLEDGDLHSDGTGRQRRFRWRNNESGDDGEAQNSDAEDGDPQAEPVVDASWQLERLERQRWLQDQADAEKAAEASARAARLSEQDSSSNFPLARMQESRLSKREGAKTPAVCGSFLKLGTSVLDRIANRIKVAARAEKDGLVTTKNFVFGTTDDKPQKKRLSSSQPGQGPAVKKPKMEVSEEPSTLSSIFNFL